ncbi:PAS/PAC sensor signal transduction histidine kinase [Fibrisoma limi BUZ 3]|uniref:histidine kinase n=1 Tax=Fibrisoma limi BUZ 3 TaxID=1185876 RepID=I2GEV0_9BACT|nr:PAS domain-containing protein [Fibrisoma limi]CCH52425.1 PAS/PAC sensor signal transduction histidine kinase [Fibrisoma limi BUZ 3]
MNGDEKTSDSTKNLYEQLNIQFALQVSGLGVWELDPKTYQVRWDDRCRELFGLVKDNVLPYQQVIQHIHPEDAERVNQALQQVLTGESDGIYDQTYRTIGADDGQLRWVRFYGRAYFAQTGDLYRFAGVAQDVTQQVLDQQQEAATRQQAQRQQRIYEAITASTPDLIYVFDRSYRFTYANRALLEMWGKSWEDSIGKSLLEIGYEPWHAQMHEREIDQVVATKQSIRGEVSFIHATLGKRIYDYVFAPVLNEQGEVEAIAGTTRDITDIRQAQDRLQEREAFLQSIIDLAEVGIYTIDLSTNQLIKSPRVAGWYGLPEVTDVATSVSVIEVSDQERVFQTYTEALASNASGYFNLEYGVVNALNGQRRVLRTSGQIVYNREGQPVRVNGSVHDITSQRSIQLTLEQQVQQRTEELAAANEELAVTNEELEEANALLVRSNDNLQQFAYVASHDLQEPLRKIQQFGDLLKGRQNSLSRDELGYIERMQSAASRMAILIRDILDFSRIATQRGSDKLVSLNEVVEQVLTTLELVIAETNAEINVDLLPSVLGDASQLTQLFQNLLGNALKFHRPSVAPLIHIRSYTVEGGALPASVKPTRVSKVYYQIDVVDNGVGFDEKYLDRIFQVFQRLHGKTQFAGTGIGLAICERVVANHGGAITASSQPGQGATFTVYLPA